MLKRWFQFQQLELWADQWPWAGVWPIFCPCECIVGVECRASLPRTCETLIHTTRTSACYSQRCTMRPPVQRQRVSLPIVYYMVIYTRSNWSIFYCWLVLEVHNYYCVPTNIDSVKVTCTKHKFAEKDSMQNDWYNFFVPDDLTVS